MQFLIGNLRLACVLPLQQNVTTNGRSASLEQPRSDDEVTAMEEVSWLAGRCDLPSLPSFPVAYLAFARCIQLRGQPRFHRVPFSGRAKFRAA